MKLFCIFVFFLGVFLTISQKSHLISVFLGMEFMALSSIMLCVLVINVNACIVLLVMCMAVCEASLALSLIVSIVRFSGSDEVKNLMMDKS